MVRSFAHGAMGRRIDPSWVGPIELFLVLASAERVAHVAAAGFLSDYLSGPLPYVRHHITVK